MDNQIGPDKEAFSRHLFNTMSAYDSDDTSCMALALKSSPEFLSFRSFFMRASLSRSDDKGNCEDSVKIFGQFLVMFSCDRQFERAYLPGLLGFT